jgi:hypothetical protein
VSVDVCVGVCVRVFVVEIVLVEEGVGVFVEEGVSPALRVVVGV